MQPSLSRSFQEYGGVWPQTVAPWWRFSRRSWLAVAAPFGRPLGDAPRYRPRGAATLGADLGTRSQTCDIRDELTIKLAWSE